ncbi:hypothetical protein LguiB_005315 [Lonicera macranthoides]
MLFKEGHPEKLSLEAYLEDFLEEKKLGQKPFCRPGGARLKVPKELRVVKYHYLVAWLKFDLVKSVGMKKYGYSIYCLASLTLALADNGSSLGFGIGPCMDLHRGWLRDHGFLGLVMFEVRPGCYRILHLWYIDVGMGQIRWAVDVGMNWGECVKDY